MTDPRSEDRSPRILLVMAVLLAAMAIVGLWDIASDSPRIWRGIHGIIELIFSLLGIAAAVVLGYGWVLAERSLVGIRGALESHRAERDAWKARAQNFLRGLGEVIDGQFEAWSLTRAEKETALFLLKGYSHKEVANLTNRSERTVRQHAVSVYRKSGLAGRAELAAFFFEDMLLPGTEVQATTIPPRMP